MKKIILILCVVMLTGCPDVIVCSWETNQTERQRIFKECLEVSAHARKGNNYTTHNDEDWDAVIEACDDIAHYQAQEKTCTKNQSTPPIYGERL